MHSHTLISSQHLMPNSLSAIAHCDPMLQNRYTAEMMSTTQHVCTITHSICTSLSISVHYSMLFSTALAGPVALACSNSSTQKAYHHLGNRRVRL